MDLWIRSQRKSRLYKCEKIEVIDNTVYINDDAFGTYETDERAMEVMNEIHNSLKQEYSFGGVYEDVDIEIKGRMLCNMYRIYQMPID